MPAKLTLPINIMFTTEKREKKPKTKDMATSTIDEQQPTETVFMACVLFGLFGGEKGGFEVSCTYVNSL